MSGDATLLARRDDVYIIRFLSLDGGKDNGLMMLTILPSTSACCAYIHPWKLLGSATVWKTSDADVSVASTRDSDPKIR